MNMVEWVNEIIKMVITHPFLLSPALIPAVIYSAKTINRKIKLNKYIKEQSVKRIQLPPSLTSNELSSIDEMLVAKKYGDDVLTFFKRMAPNIPSENLENLVNNIKDLTIHSGVEPSQNDNSKFKTPTRTSSISGSYDATANSIVMYRNGDRRTIYNELMYMAGRGKDNKTTGMEYLTATKSIIGSGITIGYNEILTDKYFPEYSKSNKKAHPFERMIASLMGQIVGQEYAEKCYFGNDSLSFMKELGKYSSLEEALNIISIVDDTSKSIRQSDKNDPLFQLEVRTSMQLIVNYLTRCYNTKLAMENDRGREKKMADFIREIKNNEFIKSNNITIDYGFVQRKEQIESLKHGF